MTERRAAAESARHRSRRLAPVGEDRLELTRTERARYFAPTLFCGFLVALCLGLVITSLYLEKLQDAAAVAAVGVFGMLVAGALGAVLYRGQRRDLRYSSTATAATAESNFEAVSAAAAGAGWRITRAEPARRLEAQTTGTLLDVGERVAVQFRGAEVRVASICDPSVGFSLTGRRRCEEHRALVQRALDEVRARPRATTGPGGAAGASAGCS